MLTADLAVIFSKYHSPSSSSMSSSGLFDVALEGVGYVDIHFGGLDVVMPHKLLDNLQIGALLNKVCGERVAQQVGINPLCYAGLPRGGFQPFGHYALGELFAGSALEHPYFRLIKLAVFGEFLNQRF